MLISVKVLKQWFDDNNQDGLRPDSVTIQLLANGQDTGKTLILTAETGWEGRFEDLPQSKNGTPIYYTIREVSVPGYYVKISGDVANGFVVVNSTTPELIDLKVTKVWDDRDNEKEIRPETVDIRLFADGVYQKTLRLSAVKNWTGAFHDLPKYADGREIVYTVQEKEIEGYVATVTGDTAKGFTVTNRYPGDVPRTGDNSHIIFWILLAGASAAGITGAMIWLKKKEQQMD